MENVDPNTTRNLITNELNPEQNKKIKLKPVTPRSYDENGYRMRVYGLCQNERGNVLLITASGNKNFHVLPGGGIDPGETPEQTVVREVLEEAGVHIKIDNYLDQVYDNNKKTRSWVFKCSVISQKDNWLENEKWPFRERMWVEDIETAVEVLDKFKKEQGRVLELLQIDQ